MRASGVAPQFQSPSRQMPSRLMWVTVALCILLPPVGLILLWSTARNPLRGKLIISIIALLSMTLMITLFLMSRQQQPTLPAIPPEVVQTQQQPTASPPPEVTPAPAQPQDSAPIEVIPANPAG